GGSGGGGGGGGGAYGRGSSTTRQSGMHPRMFRRANQKLIAGYPSDSPVSTTDEDWEAEDLNYMGNTARLDVSETSVGPDDWSSGLARSGQQQAQQHQQLAQHQILLSSAGSARGGKRHWAPGEGVIDQHLFLLDDRPWQEFYTLFFTPTYCVAAAASLLLLLLLLIDGSVLYTQLALVFLLPGCLLAVGLLANLLTCCLFPAPSGSTAPAYDTWADPLNQQ
ncbi:hypothetical protein BOX15_Mlig024310g1, partial [Macrostomum lignano]